MVDETTDTTEATGATGEEVAVAYAIEITVTRPEGDAGFDPVAFGADVVRDAILGWGTPVVRMAHLSDPEDLFSKAEPREGSTPSDD